MSSMLNNPELYRQQIQTKIFVLAFISKDYKFKICTNFFSDQKKNVYKNICILHNYKRVKTTLGEMTYK